VKYLRMVGYAVAFVVILLAVTVGQSVLFANLGVAWPETLQRAISVIVTWMVFWMAVWRPMGRRIERRQAAAAQTSGEG
jgi:hypothetical protein